MDNKQTFYVVKTTYSGDFEGMEPPPTSAHAKVGIACALARRRNEQQSTHAQVYTVVANGVREAADLVNNGGGKLYEDPHETVLKAQVTLKLLA